MEQKLFTEILPLYKSKKNHPYAMRIRMRMRDMVDAAALRYAVDITMKRYPYFCVRLQEDGNEFFFAETATEKRIGMAASVDEMASRAGTACISYVGKANFGEAEKYVREFHLWSYNSLPLTIQISAVNGKFTFDFIQKFHSPMYVNAFQKELDNHGISYDFQDGMIQELPNIRLPWSES